MFRKYDLDIPSFIETVVVIAVRELSDSTSLLFMMRFEVSFRNTTESVQEVR